MNYWLLVIMRRFWVFGRRDFDVHIEVEIRFHRLPILHRGFELVRLRGCNRFFIQIAACRFHYVHMSWISQLIHNECDAYVSAT